jgi:hypothetical protein
LSASEEEYQDVKVKLSKLLAVTTPTDTPADAFTGRIKIKLDGKESYITNGDVTDDLLAVLETVDAINQRRLDDARSKPPSPDMFKIFKPPG